MSSSSGSSGIGKTESGGNPDGLCIHRRGSESRIRRLRKVVRIKDNKASEPPTITQEREENVRAEDDRLLSKSKFKRYSSLGGGVSAAYPEDENDCVVCQALILRRSLMDYRCEGRPDPVFPVEGDFVRVSEVSAASQKDAKDKTAVLTRVLVIPLASNFYPVMPNSYPRLQNNTELGSSYYNEKAVKINIDGRNWASFPLPRLCTAYKLPLLDPAASGPDPNAQPAIQRLTPDFGSVIPFKHYVPEPTTGLWRVRFTIMRNHNGETYHALIAAVSSAQARLFTMPSVV